MKRFMLILVTLLIVSLTAIGCGKPQIKYMSIVTGGMSGVYYPMGGGISKIINDNVKDVSTSVESTGASVANLNLLNEKKGELALVAANVCYDAYNGNANFKDKAIKSVKGITSLYPEAVQIVTLEGSGIKSVADLKGKKVAIGEAGSGIEAMAREILGVHGMTLENVKPDYLGFGEASTGLKDKNLDAAFVWAGVPTAGIMDLTSQNKIRIIQLEDDKITALQAKLPYTSVVTIKGGTYANFNEDVKTVAIPSLFVVQESVSEEVVYQITKSIFENLNTLKEVHDRGKDVSLETALDGMGVPLHKGAEKYYKEVGIIK